jgi:hypothetical protein
MKHPNNAMAGQFIGISSPAEVRPNLYGVD